MLRALINSENLQLFENRTIVLIVDYMYKHFRQAILLRRLPVFLVQLTVFYMTIFTNERYETLRIDHETSPDGEEGLMA